MRPVLIVLSPVAGAVVGGAVLVFVRRREDPIDLVDQTWVGNAITGALVGAGVALAAAAWRWAR